MFPLDTFDCAVLGFEPCCLLDCLVLGLDDNGCNGFDSGIFAYTTSGLLSLTGGGACFLFGLILIGEVPRNTCFTYRFATGCIRRLRIRMMFLFFLDIRFGVKFYFRLSLKHKY